MPMQKREGQAKCIMGNSKVANGVCLLFCASEKKLTDVYSSTSPGPRHRSHLNKGESNKQQEFSPGVQLTQGTRKHGEPTTNLTGHQLLDLGGCYTWNIGFSVLARRAFLLLDPRQFSSTRSQTMALGRKPS